MAESRLKEYIDINPKVKLQKGKMYSSVEMEKITVGQKVADANSKAEYTGKSCSKFLPNDTLMARITPCLENGKIAKYESDTAGFGSTEFFVLRAKKNKATADYVYYLSQTHYIRQLAVNSMTGTSGRQRADAKYIGNIKWNFPDIEIQRKIADILSAYDNLIENNNKRIKLLEQMAKNLYKEWFVRFRFPGYEEVEFEEKKPRSWQVGTEDKKHFAPTIFRYDEFGTIGSFVRGKNITAAQMIEGNIPVISAGLQPSGYHNEANVFGENLTISASGANAGYLQYNLNDIWAADCSYYQDNATIWFVYNTLKYLQPVISNLQCGAAQPHVYPKNINSLCILIPTEELIHKYNDFVKPYYDEIKVLNKHNQLLTQQRDMLLPRLMSGKLEV